MSNDLQITPDFSAGLVKLGPDMNVSRRYRVTADVDDFVVDIDVETQDDGSVRCLGVSVRLQDDDMSHPGVSSLGLRQIPIRKLISQARRSPLVIFDDDNQSSLGPDVIRTPDQDVVVAEDRFGIRDTRPGRGRQMSDDHLSRVAKTYLAAVDAGHRPVLYVAQVGLASRPTAARWIAQARKRGLLGPARPGPLGGVQE